MYGPGTVAVAHIQRANDVKNRTPCQSMRIHLENNPSCQFSSAKFNHEFMIRFERADPWVRDRKMFKIKFLWWKQYFNLFVRLHEAVEAATANYWLGESHLSCEPRPETQRNRSRWPTKLLFRFAIAHRISESQHSEHTLYLRTSQTHATCSCVKPNDDDMPFDCVTSHDDDAGVVS